MSQQALAPSAAEVDGLHDFDFLFGEWKVANRKLEDPLAEQPTKWLEFEAMSEAGPILGGLGNYQTFLAPDFPGRPRYQGYTLRLLDPETGDWRIWWASTVGQGRLDTPVLGRFQDGKGRFECNDVLGGQAVKVRYDWKDITPSSAVWEQSFSFDEGRSFETNWVMELTRL